MKTSHFTTNDHEVIRSISGPVKALRWNTKEGAFGLQYATDAVVFDQEGQFIRMETMWINVPIIDNAPTGEPSNDQHINEIVNEIKETSSED